MSDRAQDPMFQAIVETIQRHGPAGDKLGGEDGLLMGGIVIVEWTTVSGRRWLSRFAFDGAGTPGLPTWQADGYLYAGRSEAWDDDPEDE